MTAIAVFTTTDDRARADEMAAALVERRLVACAQISRIESVYRWQDVVQRDTEYRLFLKTTRERFKDVEEALLELHNYDLPAIYAVDLPLVYGPYEDWIEAETRR